MHHSCQVTGDLPLEFGGPWGVAFGWDERERAIAVRSTEMDWFTTGAMLARRSRHCIANRSVCGGARRN